MSIKKIFEERLPAKITKELASSIAKSFQFHITGDSCGDWYVDLSGDDNWVGEGQMDAPSCSVTMSDKTLVSLFDGTLKPEMAVMTGKTKVKGDLATAMKLKVLVA
jgi:putative sterol carrier protein